MLFVGLKLSNKCDHYRDNNMEDVWCGVGSHADLIEKQSFREKVSFDLINGTIEY